jgi:ABC-type multidrug transport system ATPase subunit
MDETEALCTNIGIMVNGELKALGSLQNLKSKYGEGYTLLVKFEPVAATASTEHEKLKKINEFISVVLSQFEKTEIKENRDGFLNIHMRDTSTYILSKVFSFIEEVKSKYSIEYYVVTQTNLEQIFLNFASRQIDSETRVLKKKFLCF